MRSFEILKKATDSEWFGDESNDLNAIAQDLLTELDSELTSEDYEEGEKVVDLTDKLEAELKEVNEKDDEEEDLSLPGEEEDEDEDDEDDEFEGIDEDDEDEEEEGK